MSSIGTPGYSLRARSITARHQPHPANSAAPGADSSVTGQPHAEHGTRVHQTVDDDRRIPINGHWSPIIDICLTFKRLPAFSSAGIEGQGAAMASDTEDPEAAADRLEAALERIAQAASRASDGIGSAPARRDTEEIAARIDGLIDRLRTALGSEAD